MTELPEGQERSEGPLMPYTVEDVEAGVRVLHANFYDGDQVLDEDARIEIVALVMSTVAPKIRAAAYRAGREDAARDIDAAAEVAGWGEVWAEAVSLARGSVAPPRCCSCPDIDVTGVNEPPGSRTVKGHDPACPIHGSIDLGRSAGHDGDNTP